MYPIATTTIGSGGVSSVTFSSIPSTFTHLQIRFTGRSLYSGANDSILVRYNGDSGTNYAIHRLYGDGSSVTSQGFTSQTYVICGDMPAATSSSSLTFGSSIIDIVDYANTNKYKTTRLLAGRDENGLGFVWFNSGLWQNTNAITSIQVLAANGNLAQYSTVSLYGITTA
jgi:hypothetical protein